MDWTDRIMANPGTHPLPLEPASVPGYIKHVHCDGAREHALSYQGWVSLKAGSRGETICADQCSTPNCIVNLERARCLREHGHDVPDPVAARSSTTQAGQPNGR